MTHKIVTIVGARPQFIKAARVSRALSNANLREILVHTGQHFDAQMSQVFFDELAIPPPAFNLDVHSLSHGAMTGRMLEKLEQVLLSERPALVLVYGDTNSTLAGALAAAKLHIPVAHVEAGLRSFDRRMPEELNRVLTDHLSALLFCPTANAIENLGQEGIVNGVHAVGDVMYDSTLAATDRAQRESTILARLGVAKGEYAVCTVHRAENTDDAARFEEIMRWICSASTELKVIFPVHPRTEKLLRAYPLPSSVVLAQPLGYLDMTWLVHNARAVFTDSGGLQKEAYFHRVPCVTLRDETEWIETIEAGWNRLWKVPQYVLPRRDIADYGTGSASTAIAQRIAGFLGALT